MFHKSATLKSIDSIKLASTAKLIPMYKKLLLKTKRCDLHIWFNIECKKDGLIPNYVKIFCRNTSHSATKAVNQAKRIWLLSEIKKWYSIRHHLRIHTKIAHLELSSRLHRLEFDDIDKQIRLMCIDEEERIRKKKLKKLKELRNLQVGDNINSEVLDHNGNPHSNSEHEISFYPKVVNRSNCVFSTEEMDVLENGLKYSSPSNINKKDYFNLAIDTDIAVQNSDQFVKYLCGEKIKNSLCNFRQDRVNNRLENQILSNIKHKIVSNNIVFTKADKGNSLVILNKDEYMNKMYNFITDSGALEVKRNPTNKFQSIIKNTIKDCSNLLKDYKYSILEMNPQAPVLYGLLKIHKEDAPIRPVVSYNSAPAYKICKVFNELFVKFTNFESSYSIKNSLELIKKIEHLELTPNSRLVSFDVKNLFPSIPVHKLKNIMLQKINDCVENDVIKKELIELCNVVIGQNYFQFNNKYYIMKEGLAMGSPSSPLEAEIFMNNFEEKIFNNDTPYKSYIKFWYRYVDDVLVLWEGSDENLDGFLSWINQIENNLQFTLERENNNQINFLDLTILRKHNKLIFEIYRKPSYSDAIIPAKSNHPFNIKLSSFHAMIHRLFNVPLSSNAFNEEVKIIKTIATRNGFSNNLIDKLIENKYKKIILKHISALTPLKEDNNYNYIRLPFIGKISYEIAKIIKENCKVKVAFYNNKTIKNQLVNSKEKCNILDKPGVYEIRCDNCDYIYIGQTGRNFRKRFQEHISSYKNCKINSAIAKHLLDEEHDCNINNLKVLHIEKKGRRLDLLENFEIDKAKKCGKNILNEQTDFVISPILKKIL